jgi:hypothetical protein
MVTCSRVGSLPDVPELERLSAVISVQADPSYVVLVDPDLELQTARIVKPAG